MFLPSTCVSFSPLFLFTLHSHFARPLSFSLTSLDNLSVVDLKKRRSESLIKILNEDNEEQTRLEDSVNVLLS
ncbi:hypothetical protein Scep_015334 [Stephania cephalantha]|uniref:Uncharacterized protein n=1 Tax=Stephania cephalantha TaxID=152367 RepID=A0AAP0P1A2_9MAGN